MKLFYTLLFIFAFTNISFSQIKIVEIEEFERVKNGTTYLTMKDPEAESVQEYIKVFKENWTLTNIEFIKFSEIEKYVSPTSTFLTIGGFVVTTSFMNTFSGENNYKINEGHHERYLEFWTLKEKYFKKGGDIENSDKINIASLGVHIEGEASWNPNIFYQYDFDGNGLIEYWQPGFVKNYILVFQNQIKNKEQKSILRGSLNYPELSKLRDRTLYISSTTFRSNNMLTGEQKIMESTPFTDEYKFEFEIITDDELSKKILSEEKEFFYLMFLSTGLNIVNSQTGECILTRYRPSTYTMKPSDFTMITQILLGEKK